MDTNGTERQAKNIYRVSLYTLYHERKGKEGRGGAAGGDHLSNMSYQIVIK